MVTAFVPAPKSIIHQGDYAYMQVGNAVVRCAIMLVGPELAAEWLNREHKKNRRTPSVTARYAAEMKAGGWRPSPEPIIFAAGGDLIDGGNRLRAIIKSEQTIVLTVWWDWPEDAFNCLNRGKSRTLYQADSMSGEAMPKQVYQISRTLVFMDTNTNTMSDVDVRDRAKVILPAWEAMSEELTQIRVGRSSLRIPVQLALCIGWMSAPRLVESFVKESKEAIGHTQIPGIPVKNFLRWYQNVQGSDGSLYPVKDLVYGTASALRQYALKQEVASLHATEAAWEYWRNKPEVLQAFVDVYGVGA